MPSFPYVTVDIPGTLGQIKQEPNDFKVVEVPSYLPSGKGEHMYLLIEKVGITTFDVIQQLVRMLRLSHTDVGYAGVKDCHAVTQQYFSVPANKVKPYLDTLELYNAKVISSQLHGNKLRIGHLVGNRFEITIRNPKPDWQSYLPHIVEILQQRGVPNYYGPQRFGNQENTHLLGKYLLQEKYDDFLKTMFETEHPNDSPALQRAKKLFLQKDYLAASNEIPSIFTTEKFLLRSLANGASCEKAVKQIRPRTRAFYVSAYQSYLFNMSLAQRLQEYDCLWVGDLAMKHPVHAVFSVEEANMEREQQRCQKHEISPTGPMFGYKMITPTGKQGENEAQIVAQENLDVVSFENYHYKGERRSYRFFTNITWKPCDTGIFLECMLPSGCYATVVLAEIMKTPLERPDIWDDEETIE